MSERDSEQLFSGAKLPGPGDRLKRYASGPSGPPLTLRPLTAGVGFVKAVTCPPGNITIIKGDSDSGVTPFREAFYKGTSADVPVDIRYGTQELHPSELSIVGDSETFLTAGTAATALEAAGCPEGTVGDLLEYLAIKDFSVSDLPEGVLKRLAVACSLYGPSRVVVYDKPFERMETQWVDRVATLMLESVQRTGRIFVVTSVGRLPSVWRGQGSVRIEAARPGRMRRISFHSASTEPSESIDTVRELLNGNRITDESESVVLTRPQKIHRPKRAAVPEALQTEAIQNPHLRDLLPPGTEANDSDATPNAPVSAPAAPRSRGRSLTKVSAIRRLARQSPVMRAFLALEKRVEKFFASRASGETVLSSAKFSESRKKYKRQKIFILLTVVLCAVVLWQVLNAS